MIQLSLLLCFSLLMAVIVTKVWAEDSAASDPAGVPPKEEKNEFSFGKVKEISKGKMTLSTFMPQTNQVIDRIFTEDSQTKVQGGKRLKDLKAGDFAEVDYAVINGQNILRYVTPGAGELPKDSVQSSELRMDEAGAEPYGEAQYEEDFQEKKPA